MWSDEAAAVDTENSVIAVTTEDLADEEVDGDELDLELGSPWHDSESGRCALIVIKLPALIHISVSVVIPDGNPIYCHLLQK